MKYYESRYKYYYIDNNTKTRETKVVITDISNGGTE